MNKIIYVNRLLMIFKTQIEDHLKLFEKAGEVEFAEIDVTFGIKGNPDRALTFRINPEGLESGEAGLGVHHCNGFDEQGEKPHWEYGTTHISYDYDAGEVKKVIDGVYAFEGKYYDDEGSWSKAKYKNVLN